MGNRFVLTLNRNNDFNVPFIYKAFKVSADTEPYDVTVPLNTVYYTFITAEVDTAEELVSSFMTIQIGNRMFLNNSITFEYENDGQRYWIGKLISFEGTVYIRNEEANILVPLHCLAENDEIIDL